MTRGRKEESRGNSSIKKGVSLPRHESGKRERKRGVRSPMPKESLSFSYCDKEGLTDKKKKERGREIFQIIGFAVATSHTIWLHTKPRKLSLSTLFGAKRELDYLFYGECK